MANDIRNKKVVVTGGAGFIGSHLVKRLVELECKVIVIDDLSAGKIQNIDMYIKNHVIEFIKGSIIDLPSLQTALQGVDYVFHEAAIVSVPKSMVDPKETNEVNVGGTLNVLIAARENQVKKVVFASSAAVYGDEPSLPKQENMKANPLSPYAVSKIAGEYYCEMFARAYGLPSVSLRYFNAYGPRQDVDSQYSAVVPKFIERMMQGKRPIIFGDGKQTRDFTFVSDIVTANIQASQCETDGVFNIGSSESTNLNLLVRIIAKYLNREDLHPIYKPQRPGDIQNSLADITKARSIGYIPKYDIEKGIIETINSLIL